MAALRRFVGYRRQVPEHYVEGGYGNAADEVQFEGVLFSDDTVVLRWCTQFRSTSVWSSMDEMLAVHGHADYGTVITFLDTGP